MTITTAQNAGEIEQVIVATAARPGGALIVLPAPVFRSSRELVVRLAASHKRPAIYPCRY